MTVRGDERSRRSIDVITTSAPTVAATKVDAQIVDADGDTRVDPGDRVRYTVTVTNTGNEALAVDLTDTVDANTTLVAGSVSSTPVAHNDQYGWFGNVTLRRRRLARSRRSSPTTQDADGDTADGPGRDLPGDDAAGRHGDPGRRRDRRVHLQPAGRLRGRRLASTTRSSTTTATPRPRRPTSPSKAWSGSSTTRTRRRRISARSPIRSRRWRRSMAEATPTSRATPSSSTTTTARPTPAASSSKPIRQLLGEAVGPRPRRHDDRPGRRHGRRSPTRPGIGLTLATNNTHRAASTSRAPPAPASSAATFGTLTATQRQRDRTTGGAALDLTTGDARSAAFGTLSSTGAGGQRGLDLATLAGSLTATTTTPDQPDHRRHLRQRARAGARRFDFGDTTITDNAIGSGADRRRHRHRDRQRRRDLHLRQPRRHHRRRHRPLATAAARSTSAAPATPIVATGGPAVDITSTSLGAGATFATALLDQQHRQGRQPRHRDRRLHRQRRLDQRRAAGCLRRQRRLEQHHLRRLDHLHRRTRSWSRSPPAPAARSRSPATSPRTGTSDGINVASNTGGTDQLQRRLEDPEHRRRRRRHPRHQHRRHHQLHRRRPRHHHHLRRRLQRHRRRDGDHRPRHRQHASRPRPERRSTWPARRSARAASPSRASPPTAPRTASCSTPPAPPAASPSRERAPPTVAAEPFRTPPGGVPLSSAPPPSR